MHVSREDSLRALGVEDMERLRQAAEVLRPLFQTPEMKRYPFAKTIGRLADGASIGTHAYDNLRHVSSRGVDSFVGDSAAIALLGEEKHAAAFGVFTEYAARLHATPLRLFSELHREISAKHGAAGNARA